MTDNEHYSWRSDLLKVKILNNGSSFMEYTKDGFETTFEITVKEPCSRYEFDISNKNMSGHWIGVFSTESNKTKVEFTEEVQMKNPVFNLFVGSYVKKQQKTYINDLKRALIGKK